MSHIKNISDVIKDHTVVVENGSGVLIQPMTDKYSYILTAKHNLKIDPKDPKSRLKEPQDIKLTTFSDKNLPALTIYPHETLDIAIIRIDFYSDLYIYPYQSQSQIDDELWLYGYPGTRRHRGKPTSEWMSSYKLTVHDTTREKITFSNYSIAPQEDVEGFSGGGLFYLNDKQDQAFLAGIEHAMENSEESHERLKGIPITAFEHIIKKYLLAPLTPLHLSNFKYLQDKIFIFENCFDVRKLQSVTGLLNHYASQQLANCSITPLQILQLFKENLRVYKQNDSELEKKGLWVAFLELLAVEAILNPPQLWDLNYIKSLFKSYRIIYIDSNKSWKAHLDKVLATNTIGLKPDGKILLVTGGLCPDNPDVLSNLNSEVIPNIFNGLSGDAIDNAMHIYSNKTAIIHLPKLHNVCIEEKEWDYAKLNRVMHEKEMTDMLRADYNQYLQVVEPNHE